MWVGFVFGAALCSWFHANVPDLKSAETLLLRQGFDGSYLVRRSKSTKGAYSLSVRSVGYITSANWEGCAIWSTCAVLVQGHRSWGLAVLTPWKYVGGNWVCFDPQMSHSFIQNCCCITLQVSHHQGWKTCVKKWKVKLIFRGAWNSLMAWPDWFWPRYFTRLCSRIRFLYVARIIQEVGLTLLWNVLAVQLSRHGRHPRTFGSDTESNPSPGRQKSSFRSPHNIDIAARRFSVAAPRLWNSLALSCWTAPSVNVSRTELRHSFSVCDSDIIARASVLWRVINLLIDWLIDHSIRHGSLFLWNYEEKNTQPTDQMTR